MPAEIQRALKEDEAAALLGLSPTTLATWRSRGRGPRFRKYGRAVRYLVGDLLEFQAASAVNPEGDAQHEPGGAAARDVEAPAGA